MLLLRIQIARLILYVARVLSETVAPELKGDGKR